jgi:hypothetical protein
VHGKKPLGGDSASRRRMTRQGHNIRESKICLSCPLVNQWVMRKGHTWGGKYLLRKAVNLQPNYLFAYREYFDDYTHVTVYSHISLCDFLAANGFEVMNCQPRFMPLTVKSRLRVSPWLIRAYLHSPIKPLGKQMLIRARVSPTGAAMATHSQIENR